MCAIQGLLSLVGRVMLTAVFLTSAIGNKIPNFQQIVQFMVGEGVPAPKVMLAGAIVFLILGSMLVILGWKARWGATMLLVFLVLAAYFFHDFWTMQGDALQEQMIQFMKNLALMGAMVFVIANGPGAGSLDGCCKKPSTENGSTGG